MSARLAHVETAYAKLNLALHVRRRRTDGYHEIETLFAFLDDGDRLSVEPAKDFSFTLTGPFAGDLSGEDEAQNLVIRAARMVGNGALPLLSVTLDKRIPVAAGLGGGSADAAAMLRLMGGANSYALAASLGADVPACLASRTVTGSGTGTHLADVESDISGLAVLIVNPGVTLATPLVFAGWDRVDHGPLPSGDAREIMLRGRNDLEQPATASCPEIADVLAALRETRPLTARMSGSGASCFAVFDDADAMLDAEWRIAASHPAWYRLPGRLR